MEPEGERGGPLRALALPALRLLAPEALFGRPQRVLDRPPSEVVTDDGSRVQREIRGEQEVVLLVSLRVAAHDDPNGTGTADVVPEHFAGQEETLLPPPPLIHHRHRPTVPGVVRPSGQRGEPRPLLRGPPHMAPPIRPRGVVERRIPSDLRGDSGAGEPPPGKRSVRPVGDEVEVPVGEPLGEPTDRGGGEIEEGRAALTMEADGEGKGEGFAAPRRLDPKGKDNEVQATVVDDGAAAGTHGVPENPGAVDLPSSAMEERVIEEEIDAPLLREDTDQELGGEVLEVVQRPSGGADQAEIGVVGSAAHEAAAAHHAGDGAAGGAENPRREELLEDGEGRDGEEGSEEFEEGEPPGQGLGGDVDRRVLGVGALRSECSRRLPPGLGCFTPTRLGVTVLAECLQWKRFGRAKGAGSQRDQFSPKLCERPPKATRGISVPMSAGPDRGRSSADRSLRTSPPRSLPV